LKPEDCYLSWELELQGAVARDAVAEVFAWVEDDCDLRIEAPVKKTAAKEPPPIPQRLGRPVKKDNRAS
jgi:two-component system chemotaxis sensor kinase CheA